MKTIYPVRINKYLAQLNYSTRVGGDELVKKGLVFINGRKAVLGDKVNLKVIEGTNILLEIPQGTESGKILRISGKGIPHFQGHGRGNLYVELKINIPKKLSREQKKLMEDLRKQGL